MLLLDTQLVPASFIGQAVALAANDLDASKLIIRITPNPWT